MHSINYLYKSKDKMRQERKHLELNNFCESIKILLSKAGIRQYPFYKMLLPIFKEGDFFLNKDKSPKSFSTFRRYLNPCSNENSNLKERQILIHFILDYILRPEDIEYIYLKRVNERERQIRKLTNQIESDYPEPVNISDETLKSFIKELETKGLVIKK